MLSYALDVWRVSWITAASKAQSGLLAVPEDTSLQKKKGGKVFIKFATHRQAACFYFILSMCVCVFDCDGAKASRQPSSQLFSYWHTFCDWPVSKAITGRLLHAFMKYSNGSMSYCALIMPHKEKKGGALTGRQKTIMKEHLIYCCGQKSTLCFSPLWTINCLL